VLAALKEFSGGRGIHIMFFEGTQLSSLHNCCTLFNGGSGDRNTLFF
jgi:hypothetical protein